MTFNLSNPGNKRNRGVALITALLLLSLFTVMTLSMVIATTSDTLIDGYYRNARGSFYGADSGVNVVRQYMINQLNSFVPSPFTTFSTPISSANEQSIMTSIGNSSSGFGAFQSILGSQTASWPGKFQVSYNSGCATTGGVACPTYMTLPATCTVSYTSATGTIPTCYAAGNGSATWYQLSYPYQITIVGQSSTNETNTIVEQGTIFLTVTISASSSSSSSFAAWGMFIDQSPICDGSTLVGGEITGAGVHEWCMELRHDEHGLHLHRRGGQRQREYRLSIWKLLSISQSFLYERRANHKSEFSIWNSTGPAGYSASLRFLRPAARRD